MNGKKILFAILTLILLMICVSACQATNLPHTVGREFATEQTESKTETQKKVIVRRMSGSWIQKKPWKEKR